MKPEWLRLALAAIVLVIAIRIFIGFSIQPDEIHGLSLGGSCSPCCAP